MLVAGDEISRTQHGNNNAYCQDNEVSWVNWKNADHDLLEFTKKLIHFRRSHPAFCRRRWFQGQPIKGIGLEDIAWFLHDGTEMSDEHWNEDFAKTLGVFLFGKGLHAVGPKGEQITDDSFYIIFNAHHESLTFTLPPEKYGKVWTKLIDTTSSTIEHSEEFKAREDIEVAGRSVVLLHHPLT
jgi:isoamylase